MLTYRPLLLSAFLFCLALVTFSSNVISEPQDVSLYLDGEPDGDLVLSEPDDEKSIIIASNDTSQGQDQIIGNWTYDSLLFETETGDVWSGNIAIPHLLFDNREVFNKNLGSYFKIEHDKTLHEFSFLNSGGVSSKTFCIPLNYFFIKILDKIYYILTKPFPKIFAIGRRLVLKKNN